MQIEKPWLKQYERIFIPKNFKLSDWDTLEPFFENLEKAQLKNTNYLEKWLDNTSELSSVIGEEGTVRYTQMTCHTNDEEKKKAYLQFIKEFQPKLLEWSNKLDKKYYKCSSRKKLPQKEYEEYNKKIETAILLHSPKNIPLSTKLSELSQKHQEITGNWVVDFDGKERTMPEMGKLLLSQDRSVREKAWFAAAQRRLQDKNTLENLYDEMLHTRQEFSHNLNLKDYREYCFKSKLRVYTEDDCFKLHEAIEKAVVPLVRKMNEEGKKEMKLKTLKPWDLSVDASGKPPLESFKNIQELQDGAEKIFYKIDSRLGERFHSIRPYMDLDSRKGKAPGGYQACYSERRLPFIFANATGVHNDVRTLLHESGHAFHTLQCRDQKLISYRHGPMEFCEVASMTQELLALPYLGVFYSDKDDYKRACEEQLKGTITILPWIAQVDAFQHWIYTHPQHTIEERSQTWIALSERFEKDIDWKDIPEEIKAHSWHRQLHIFQVPFYYIEYAISQLGALQIYRNYKKNPKKALSQYLNALALGGSRNVKELFKEAGIQFDFSIDLIQELTHMVADDLSLSP
ncbi:MAG: M3 family oligoendopeptidase [Deltaproteobacteria bacterium]|nr:M3 family oligoendopeptidase [Deltaproteobacteria bacterium]